MQSKNKPRPSAREAEHIERIKLLPCSVCDEPGPSDAHEIKQGQWWTSVALCKSCHQGPVLGLHGQRRAWLVRKMDEMDALARTVEQLMAEAYA